MIDFEIEKDKCSLCKNCLQEGFCFYNFFSLKKEKESGNEIIIFMKNNNRNRCINCLKCYKDCPNNAIIPIIIKGK